MEQRIGWPGPDGRRSRFCRRTLGCYPDRRLSTGSPLEPLSCRSLAGVAHDWELSFFLLFAAILAAPFELLVPVISSPGQSLTNLEVVCLLAFVAWGVRCARARRIPVPGAYLTVPLLLLLGTLGVSALFAAKGPEAYRFTGRFAAGLLICFLVSDMVSTRLRLVRVMSGAALSAAAVGLVGTLEYFQIPWVMTALGRVREGPSYVASQIRVSSTLQYPTIASMYLEIAFGLVMGLLALAAWQKRLRWAVAFGAILVVTGTCVFLTLTRSGMATLAVMLVAAMVFWYRRCGFDRVVVALVLVGVSLVTTSAFLLVWSTHGLRWLEPDVSRWYRAGYEAPAQLTLPAGQQVEIGVTVTNQGRATWHSSAHTPLRLSYHWLSAENDQVLVFEGLRTEVAGPLAPGEMRRVQAFVETPAPPGEYRMAWDMLFENSFWFSHEYSPPGITRVKVLPTAATGPVEALTPQPFPLRRFKMSRVDLWRIALKMLAESPVLGVGPDNFRHLYGEAAGLQVWDRHYHANNVYIEMFLSAGLLGGALFLWFLWRLCRVVGTAWTTAATADLPLVLGFSASIGGVMLHGLVDSFLSFTPTYVMTWTVIGLAVAWPGLCMKCRSEGTQGPC